MSGRGRGQGAAPPVSRGHLALSRPHLSLSCSLTSEDHSGTYSCIFLPETVGRGDFKVAGE